MQSIIVCRDYDMRLDPNYGMLKHNFNGKLRMLLEKKIRVIAQLFCEKLFF